MTKRFICYFMTFLAGATCTKVSFASNTVANTANTVANVASTVANAANTVANTANAITNTANTATPQYVLVQPATTNSQTTTQTAAEPSMLSVNDEYTDIVRKIDAEMDVIMAECSSLGLKKPEFLTGTQQQNTAQSSNTETNSSSSASSDTEGSSASDSSTANLDADTAKAVQIIVDFLGPDTEQQKQFFTALAISYIKANDKDNNVLLDDAFVLDFLGTDNNFETYRLAVRDLTGKAENEELGISIDWDNVITQISIVLDKVQQKRGIIVCENNRSYEVGIDVVVTAVAAIATFYTGGAGAVAATAGRAALGASLKAAAKAAAKVGAKSVAKKMSKAGGKQLAKQAVKLGLKANMRGWNNYAGKGVLKTGVQNFAQATGANLKNKWKLLAAAGGTFWALDGGKVIAGTGAGTGYSLISSDLDKEYLNCQDLDHNEGCYTVCGDTGGNDDLNTKVFQPILGKKYCVNPKDYALYEMNSNGSAGTIMTVDGNKKAQIFKTIKQSVVDQGKCDSNEDDIDLYVGFYVYDPDTLEINKEAIVIDDAVRLDD